MNSLSFSGSWLILSNPWPYFICYYWYVCDLDYGRKIKKQIHNMIIKLHSVFTQVTLSPEERMTMHFQEVLVSNWKRELLISNIKRKLIVIHQNIFQPVPENALKAVYFLKRYYDPFKKKVHNLECCVVNFRAFLLKSIMRYKSIIYILSVRYSSYYGFCMPTLNKYC